MAAGRQNQSLTARGRFWWKHLQQWRQSGLSQAQYCRQHQLSLGTFGWWKGRLSATDGPVQPIARRPAAGQRNPFVELTLGASEASTPAGAVVYEIVLSRQRSLRLGCGFELERVRQLLRLLEGSC
jgi:hypothetical protein